MMEIYKPLVGEWFEYCYPERQDDFETLNVQIDGTPRRATWRPMRMRLVHEDEGRSWLPPTRPGLDRTR